MATPPYNPKDSNYKPASRGGSGSFKQYGQKTSSGQMQFNPNAKLNPSQVQDRRQENRTSNTPGTSKGWGWSKPSADNASVGKKWNQPGTGNNVGSTARSDAIKRAGLKYK